MTPPPQPERRFTWRTLVGALLLGGRGSTDAQWRRSMAGYMLVALVAMQWWWMRSTREDSKESTRQLVAAIERQGEASRQAVAAVQADVASVSAQADEMRGFAEWFKGAATGHLRCPDCRPRPCPPVPACPVPRIEVYPPAAPVSHPPAQRVPEPTGSPRRGFPFNPRDP